MSQMEISLDEAFASRPNRFRLLERGNMEAGWNNPQNLLEVGCSIGDASAFMADQNGHMVTAIDLSSELIQRAKESHKKEIRNGNLSYRCEDAKCMPFEDNFFDGVYSEAAFSPIPQKEKVLREYVRVLKPGGKYLINDFGIKDNVGDEERITVSHIPCFAGVGTVREYKDMFEEVGFKVLSIREDYSELIRVSSWLAKVYHLDAMEVGTYLSGYYRSGASKDCVSCGNEKKEDDFFTRAKLTYYQIILEKMR